MTKSIPAKTGLFKTSTGTVDKLGGMGESLRMHPQPDTNGEPVLTVRRLHPEAALPAYAHPGDAGLDLCACARISLNPGGIARVPTGLALELPEGTEGQVRPRSGLAAKHGVSVLNAPGTIDAGYRGEICVLLVNHGGEVFEVSPGMRIAQLVIAPVLRVGVREVQRHADSARGAGGFGSTGL